MGPIARQHRTNGENAPEFRSQKDKGAMRVDRRQMRRQADIAAGIRRREMQVRRRSRGRGHAQQGAKGQQNNGDAQDAEHALIQV